LQHVHVFIPKPNRFVETVDGACEWFLEKAPNASQNEHENLYVLPQYFSIPQTTTV
jgi:hypothetical protein